MTPDLRRNIIIIGSLVAAFALVIWLFVLRENPEMAQIRKNQAAAAADRRAEGEGSAVSTTGVSASISSVFQDTDVNINELIQNIREVEFKYEDAREARNPMSPLVGGTRFTPGSAASYGREAGGGAVDENLVYEANRKDVTGIIWDDTRPLAVIDDEIVGVGYVFDERILVKEIAELYVVLSLKLDGNEELEIVKELKEQ